MKKTGKFRNLAVNKDLFYDELIKVVKNDGFILIVLEGDKGFGKSNAMLEIVHNILARWTNKECWDQVLKHVIFTIDDFWNLSRRTELIRDDRKRIVAVGWDDFGMHTSGYAFLRGEGAKVGEFIEDFEAVREICSVLVVSVATFGILPPAIREKGQVHFRVVMVKRGKAIAFKRERYIERDLDKWKWKAIVKMPFDKVPEDVYSKYRQMKRRAEEVRRKMVLIKKVEKAKKVAEKLSAEDWKDEIKLIALGIKDIHGNWTEFGLIVRGEWEKIGENVTDDFILPDLFQNAINFREFVTLMRNCGIKAEQRKALEFYHSILNELKSKSTVLNV